MLCTLCVFSQEEAARRSSIPEELLRPRRDEAPRYPVDTVIGSLGQGGAPQEAYKTAKDTASAFLAGNINAFVLTSVNRVFAEGCMNILNTINPRSFRLGGGREEPDGSYSFLVRFLGREQSITGELFVRFDERQPGPKPGEQETERENTAEETETASETEGGTLTDLDEQAEGPLPRNIPVQKIWLFEDLILEEARSREEENRENRHRFDFSPYERIF